MMKTMLVLLALSAATFAQAQNVETRQIPGMSHYEHKFTNIHRIGDVGDEKYPHVQVYCRSNDSDMVLFKMIVERKGATAIGTARTIPMFNCDGDEWKGTNVTYESFPLSDGVLESFEFFAPMILMEMLANSDEVQFDIDGAVYAYDAAFRKDFKDLHAIVLSRNKQPTNGETKKVSKPSFR